MTQDDRIHPFRLRLFSPDRELVSVRPPAGSWASIPSTHYHWRAQLLRYGPEILNAVIHG